MGLRSLRLFEIAVFDVLGVALAAYIFNKMCPNTSRTGWFWLLFSFGIVVHKILGVDTMLGYYLGINGVPRRV
jgi:hypothetical protein